MDNDVNDDLDVMFDDNQSATGTTEETTTTDEGAPDTGKTTEDKTEKQEQKQEQDKTEKTDEADDTKEKTAEDGAEENGEADQADKASTEEKPAEEPKPLTAEEARALFNDIRAQERDSGKEVEAFQQDILKAYYPQGLSNTLVDERTGREIKTPQDVVELSNGEMSTEEAAQWLINEQYKLDQQVNEIKSSARELAETNANFRTGAVRVVETYQGIFDKYPQLQEKVYKSYMKQVKMEQKKIDGKDVDLVLSAPDIEEYYRDFMEPYVMAFGFSQKDGAAAPPANADEKPAEDKPKIPESRQTAKDRMDESGDAGGGSNDVDENDPNATLNKLFGE